MAKKKIKTIRILNHSPLKIAVTYKDNQGSGILTGEIALALFSVIANGKRNR